MGKDKFMKQLELGLGRLPKAERADILQDYEEHFIFGGEAGESEEEIAAALGNPAQLARELMAGYHVDQATELSSAGNVFRAILALGGLGFFNLVFVLGPALAIFSVIFSFWIVALTFIATPVIVILFGLINLQTFEWHNFFGGLLLSGIGIFLFMGVKYITGLTVKLTIRYLKLNLKLIKGDK